MKNSQQFSKFLLLAVAFPIVGFAQQKSMSESEEYAALQAKIPLLKLQAEIAKLKSEVDSKQGGMNLPQMPRRDSGSSMGLSDFGGPMFVLESVMGINGQMQAVLQSMGRRKIVTVGDTLDEGWRVKRIEAKSIELSRGKERKTFTI